jgi:hypothetical protein
VIPVHGGLLQCLGSGHFILENVTHSQSISIDNPERFEPTESVVEKYMVFVKPRKGED